MHKPAFLVDGHQEKKFIQRACPGIPVRIINLNGDDVEIQAIVKHVGSLIRLLGSRYYPIVIIIDREGRDKTSETLCAEIIQGLREEGIADDLIVGVADRMIENWILADNEIVCGDEGFQKKPPDDCEGLNGKKVIKECIRNYQETTVGVELLLKCRASRIREKSSSFASLYQELPFKKSCRWLAQ